MSAAAVRPPVAGTPLSQSPPNPSRPTVATKAQLPRRSFSLDEHRPAPLSQPSRRSPPNPSRPTVATKAQLPRHSYPPYRRSFSLDEHRPAPPSQPSRRSPWNSEFSRCGPAPLRRKEDEAAYYLTQLKDYSAEHCMSQNETMSYTSYVSNGDTVSIGALHLQLSRSSDFSLRSEQPCLQPFQIPSALRKYFQVLTPLQSTVGER
ncbi:unnamed protein product [Linum trigynum]|uniref:Uncharacterized protein n=1 Tax=Linum trigynum TaxID=586398 RepID=A0AAV2F319_9ROSI